MQDVCNISLPVLPNWLESVRLNIGFPVVRTDGRVVYGHVITKFSGMGRFTYPWCSAGALRAPELRYQTLNTLGDLGSYLHDVNLLAIIKVTE